MQSLRHARFVGRERSLEEVVNQFLKVLRSATIMAAQFQGFSCDHLQPMRQRFTKVGGDAVGEGALDNIGNLFTQFNRHFLSNAVRSNDGDMGIGGNKCQAIEFILSQFSVFDLDDVFCSHFL